MDELEGRCVGFTTVYIPGGTLEENKTRVFKLNWLRQLTAVIDELNLNLGIAHQDVAPRNLLIIFDFNFSVRIGEPGYSESRNNIDGVLFTMYEIITRDDTLRAVRHEELQTLNAKIGSNIRMLSLTTHFRNFVRFSGNGLEGGVKANRSLTTKTPPISSNGRIRLNHHPPK